MVGNQHVLTVGRRVARLPGPSSAVTNKVRMTGVPPGSGELTPRLQIALGECSGTRDCEVGSRVYTLLLLPTH